MSRKPPSTRARRAPRAGFAIPVALGAVALVAGLTPPAGGAEATVTSEDVVYHSRPDIRQLQAPTLTTRATDEADPGLLLTTPFDNGAVIYDNTGEPVWISPGHYTNLQEITWRGEPALAALTVGEAVVLDASYTEVATLTMGDGLSADLHTLAFDEDGSHVLLTAYVGTPYDLSEFGGAADATVMDTIIQEIDTATGEVTFEWTGLDHISPAESHESMTTSQVDYLHTNSVAYANDGDILLSARHTSTIYKIDVDTGEIVWRFGGRESDFAFPGGEDEMPSYQHDATQLPDGRLAAFDNGVGRDPQVSRGAVWELDEEAMTARLVADLQPADPVYGEVMGSNQLTGNGNQIVDYGNSGEIVEFADGQEVFSASFEQGVYSYKVFRTRDFVGQPASPPDVAWTKPAADGTRDVYVSWNGATEVDRWRLEARAADGDFQRLATVARTGFETEVEDVAVPEDADVLRVSALAEDGEVLGTRTLTEGDQPTVG